MKKIISLFLCIVILFMMPYASSAMDVAEFDWLPETTEYESLPRGKDVVARIVIGSDSHIGEVTASPKLENAFKAIGKLGGADAFIIAGDLTDLGHAAQYDELMRIVSENSRELTVDFDSFSMKGAGYGAPVETTYLLMGNHEFFATDTSAKIDRFTSKTGQNTNKMYWVCDKVPVIMLSMKGMGENKAYKYHHDFIAECLAEIDNVGYKGHIFLVSHLPIGGTMAGSGSYDSSTDAFTPETIELLKRYPQIIHVSGHSHSNPYNPKFIDQSIGFTCITDGVLGKSFGNNPDIGSTAIIFDVKSDGSTQFYRVDFQNGTILFKHENWILDSGDTPKDFKYFAEPSQAVNKTHYGSECRSPVFDDNAFVTMEDIGNHDTVNVTFSRAKEASANNYDLISHYRVRAVPVDFNGETISTTVSNDSHIPESMKSEHLTVTLEGLSWNTDYKFEVTAYTYYGKMSLPVTSEETLNVGGIETAYPPKLIYDIDHRTECANDIEGHASSISPDLKISKDDTLEMPVLLSDEKSTNKYSFTKNDFEAVKNAFTLEAMVNISVPFERQAIVDLKDIAGFSLEYVNFDVYATANTPYVSADVCRTSLEPRNWAHLVLTYDSKHFTLYINGHEAVKEVAPGGLIPLEDSDDGYMYVCNSADGKKPLAPKSGIAYVRLYSGAMKQNDVFSAYSKARTPMEFTDVENSDWFSPSVLYSYKHGLMQGTSDTVFAPATATSRAMIVQMLYNMEGRPEVEYKPVFTDVKEDAWYADAVIWAYENGVTTGSSATTFSPDTLVTREQVAVFLYRFMKDYKGEEMADGADLSAFPDESKISPYAGFADAVAWANGVGIITGKTSADGAILAPLDNAQRCETATMFARFHRSFVA